MTQISVDPALQAQLANLTAPAELRDANGKTVGFALSPDEYERYRQLEEEQRRQDYEWAKSVVTNEELDAALAKAEAEAVWYTHDEVMARLRQLEEQERSKPS
jgi:multidrug efflux pump subunit AcrA (membrane-fusion protein)